MRVSSGKGGNSLEGFSEKKGGQGGGAFLLGNAKRFFKADARRSMSRRQQKMIGRKGGEVDVDPTA